MKKILSVLVIAVILAVSCKAGKENENTAKMNENVSFEYSALTRGSFKKVMVSSTEIATANGRDKGDMTVKKTTPQEWKKVYDAYKAVKNPQGIGELEAPTKKHQYDGALAATLTIKTADGEYSTMSFDHGTPPAEIKGLVESIIAVSDLNKKQV